MSCATVFELIMKKDQMSGLKSCLWEKGAKKPRVIAGFTGLMVFSVKLKGYKWAQYQL